MTHLYHTPTGTHLFSRKAYLCPVCLKMSHWFINTGWTRCMTCKIEEEMKDEQLRIGMASASR